MEAYRLLFTLRESRSNIREFHSETRVTVSQTLLSALRPPRASLSTTSLETRINTPSTVMVSSS